MNSYREGETRRQGEGETRRGGDKERGRRVATISLSPCLLVLLIHAVGLDDDFRRHLFAVDRELDQIGAWIERGAGQSAKAAATAPTTTAAPLRRPLLPLTGLRLSSLS